MFTWAEILLLILKIANAIADQVGSAKSYQSGVDAEIARVTQEILRKSAIGKAIMEKVDGLSDADVDAELRGLEPK